uniref:Uncharacterized protein n=1 Tax=Globodera rostochiensis TaxID=31243 RepID=A0A914IDI9_GLORO
MINKISHLILEHLYRLRQDMANKNSHLVLLDQQKHRQLDQHHHHQHRQLDQQQHRKLDQQQHHQLDQHQHRQLDQHQHRQLDQQQHRKLDQQQHHQLDQHQHRQLDQQQHHQLDQHQHRQLDQQQHRQLDQQQHQHQHRQLDQRQHHQLDQHQHRQLDQQQHHQLDQHQHRQLDQQQHHQLDQHQHRQLDQQQHHQRDQQQHRQLDQQQHHQLVQAVHQMLNLAKQRKACHLTAYFDDENEENFEMIVHTIRQRLDHWDNEVKTKKQIKISARELGVPPTKREWDETRLGRIEHLRNEVRASFSASPTFASSPLRASSSASSLLQASPLLQALPPLQASPSSASPLHEGGGPRTNPSAKNVEKKEDNEIMVTKKYDLASHGRTLEEAKENLIKYDQKMEELKRFERQFEVLSYTGSTEVLTEQQRIEKQYEKQYVAQKIVRQICALNGVLNCLYVNVSEMLQSGFTEEKKKLSKTFIDTLRKVLRDEDETDDDVGNLNNV